MIRLVLPLLISVLCLIGYFLHRPALDNAFDALNKDLNNEEKHAVYGRHYWISRALQILSLMLFVGAFAAMRSPTSVLRD